MQQTNSPRPPRRPYDQDTSDAYDGAIDASIVEEQIEAGYDIQSDAATKPLVDDPLSSSQGEIETTQ